MSFDKSSSEQQRHRLLRMASDARALADRAPLELRSACLSAAESWEKLAETGQPHIDPAVAAPGPAAHPFPAARPVHQITLYQQVRDWLQQRAGNCFCDECVATHYGASRKNVSIATRRLGTEEGFSKYAAKCDGCGASRAVTLASRNNL
jgi:hypothetical protein